MSTYELKESNNKYDLVEKPTNSIIQLRKTRDVIEKIRSKLNVGHGFNGNTPDFFLKKSYPK